MEDNKVLTPYDVAHQHRTDIKVIMGHLKTALQIERQNAQSQAEAERIALQNLLTDLKYYNGLRAMEEDCWKGWKRKGMKKKGKRLVPNCVKEENEPTNPSLWSRIKAQAKQKFDVYPSAYANGWAAKEYKAKGGGWKKKSKSKVQKESFEPSWEVIDIIKPEPMKATPMREDLRKWFGDGPEGGWDRYNSKGEKVGKCAREDKDGDGKGDGPKPKCLSNEKAAKMSKKDIASSVKAKREKDGDADRKGKPINVKNKGLKEFKTFMNEAAPSVKRHNLQRLKDMQKMRKAMIAQQALGNVSEAAWTKKEGQNKEGGLNEKGRKSYERENPGSDLKRPSKEVGNKRRDSFCARMKGMRKRQKPENNTGDDRLSKSLRAWNC